MDYVLLMHVGDPLQDLLHVANAGGLCVFKAVVHDTFKQFSACDATDKPQWLLTGYCFTFMQPAFPGAVRIQPLWASMMLLTTP